jgi:hypothetical protein
MATMERGVRRSSHSPRDHTSMDHHQSGFISPAGQTNEMARRESTRSTFEDIGLVGAAVLGQRLSVFWEGTDEGDQWYSGHVVEYNHSKQEYLVEYDDGDTDWYDLTKIKYRILPPIDTKTDEVDNNYYDNNNNNKVQRRKTFSDNGKSGIELLGERLEIFWSDPDNGDAWYGGVIKEYRISDEKHFIQFDDGDSDWYNLSDIKYRLPLEALIDHHHHTAHGHTEKMSADGDEDKILSLAELGLISEKSVGHRVEIFWQDDDAEGGGKWYPGIIDEFNGELYHVLYDDGDAEWYDLNTIKHHVLDVTSNKKAKKDKKTKKKKKKKDKKSKKQKSKISEEQPIESRRRSQEWLEDLKLRRANRNKNPGYDVVGELSVGGVVALRTVHEAMLQDRYFKKNAQERLDEFWDIQLRARFGVAGMGQKMKKNSNGETKDDNIDRQDRTRQNNIKMMQKEMVLSHHFILPPAKASTNTQKDLHDRFHELARAHGDLHVNGLPGQVPDRDDDDDDDDHNNHVSGLQDQARKHGLDSNSKVPTTMEIVEDKTSTKEEVEQMENDLLAGAKVPPPPAPQVQVKLDGLLEAMKNGEIGEDEKHPEEYIDEFLNAVPEKEIVVGGISLRDIQLQERKIEMERLDTMRKEVLRYRRREEALMIQEERARVRVLEESDAKQMKLDQKHYDNIKRIRRLERSMRRSFIRKEDQLRQNLEDQHAIVSKKIGTLEKRKNTDELSYDVFKVKWDRVPQPVAIDIKLMRAVRDRLANGRYVFLVTLYDRIGGSPLFWTEAGLNGSTVGLPGATDPVRHKGRYYDLDMHVHKTAHTICPSQRDVKPTLTYVLELFQLGTGKWPDRVVAWSVLPAVDIQCHYTVGKFRLPLLRGPVDPDLDLYSRFEKSYTNDLDRWLCNAYIEIRLESKETITGDGSMMLSNQEIVMDYTSQLLQVRKGEWLNREEEEEEDGSNNTKMGDDGIMKDGTTTNNNQYDQPGLLANLKPRNNSELNATDKSFGGYQAPASRTKKLRNIKRQGSVRLGMSGFKGKSAVDAAHRQIGDNLDVGLSDFQKGEQLAMKTDLQSLSKYETAIMHRGSPSFTNISEAARRLVFLYHEIADEYRIRRWATIDFWVSFMILVIGFYVRLYLHFLGLFLYLKIIGVKNVHFGEPIEPMQILTKYNANMAVHLELGAAISGQIFNIFIFLCFLTINYFWRKIFGRLPDIMSKWMMGFGVGVVFDAILVFIVDMAQGNYNCKSLSLCSSSYMSTSCRCMTGDAFKLPEKFAMLEGSSAPGWVLIAIANSILFIIAG